MLPDAPKGSQKQMEVQEIDFKLAPEGRGGREPWRGWMGNPLIPRLEIFTGLNSWN